MVKVAYLFPGQGAQYVGMGKDFYDSCPESRKIFDEAEAIAPDVQIKRLCFEGPIDKLTETANSQVCILVASIAALEGLNARVTCDVSRVTACAGLSLGELTSLVAAKAIDFRDAVKLVKRRGELMEQASVKNPGSMASIIGLSLEELKKACEEKGAEIANLNCPGQIVISGTKESVEATMQVAKERGAKKSIPLNVSGGFHSSLMKEAAGIFKTELDKAEFKTPQIGVVSNVTADYEVTPDEIRENLYRQLFSPVRWEESIGKIAANGVVQFFEIGPGKVLKGLLRRIDPNLKVYNIEIPDDLHNVTL